jgi:hypothetical protein
MGVNSPLKRQQMVWHFDGEALEGEVGYTKLAESKICK